MYGLPNNVCVVSVIQVCFWMYLFCLCMLEVISSFRSLRAGSQVFALLMLFFCVILHNMWSGKSLQLLWYIVFVCHHDDVCEYYIGSVYVGGYCGLSESKLCVFGKLCTVGFLVVYSHVVSVC